MAKKIYRNLKDPKVTVVADPDVVDVISEELRPIETIHLIERVPPKDRSKADYGFQDGNVHRYFKFKCVAAKISHKSGQLCHRTSDQNAITCPECLAAAGHVDRVLELVPEKKSKKDKTPTT